MKKIYNLIAFVAVAVGLSACHPMNETYKQLDASPTANPKTLTYTLTSGDYSLLPTTSAAYKAKAFTGTADANTGIPTILNNKFVYGYDNGSNANITFTPTSANIVQPDSLYADLKYTLVNNADYLLLPKNTNADFSVAQLLSWLPYKYPNPAANEQHLLTWIFYPTIPSTSPLIYPGISLVNTVSGSTTTTMATGSFAYINGAWVQDYLITPAQYAAVGRGQYNEFTSADDANLVSIFNGILKADAGITATSKVGSVQYVSYYYYSAAKVLSQRIMALTYDGSNWNHGSAAVSLTFVKSNGTWVQDPTVYYTTTKSDFTLIGNTPSSSLAGATTGATGAIANYAQYGTFTTTSTSTSYWSPAQIDAALIVILKADFPNAKAGVPYHINYQTYSGPTNTVFETFKFDGTNWVKQ